MVVAAAGRGSRLEAGLPKQYVPLLGIPMLQVTLEALDECGRIDALAVVVNPEEFDERRKGIEEAGLSKLVAVVRGGEERPLSVREGLRALAELGTWELVGVHDGARPLVTCADVGRCVDALAAEAALDGVVLGIPSHDTVKSVDAEGVITETLDRTKLWRAQTPQIFRWDSLLAAYEQEEKLLLASTDDSFLLEKRGGRVKVVQGSSENLKITDRGDLRHAESILTERRDER